LFYSGMGIETIGEAWNFSWEIYIRCLDDGREGLKHRRRCDYWKSLDLETLVCTRGRDFPIARVAECLRCPRCGCRKVSVMFGPPKVPQRNAAAAGSPETGGGEMKVTTERQIQKIFLCFEAAPHGGAKTVPSFFARAAAIWVTS
jgi:hypothetical protein